MNNNNLKAWLKRQNIDFEMYEDDCFILTQFDVQVYNDIDVWTIDHEGTQHLSTNKALYDALKALLKEVA